MLPSSALYTSAGKKLQVVFAKVIESLFCELEPNRRSMRNRWNLLAAGRQNARCLFASPAFLSGNLMPFCMVGLESGISSLRPPSPLEWQGLGYLPTRINRLAEHGLGVRTAAESRPILAVLLSLSLAAIGCASYSGAVPAGGGIAPLYNPQAAMAPAAVAPAAIAPPTVTPPAAFAPPLNAPSSTFAMAPSLPLSPLPTARPAPTVAALPTVRSSGVEVSPALSLLRSMPT